MDSVDKVQGVRADWTISIFHGLSGHCPVQSSLILPTVSVDICPLFRSSTQCPWIMSTESMDFLLTGSQLKKQSIIINYEPRF